MVECVQHLMYAPVPAFVPYQGHARDVCKAKHVKQIIILDRISTTIIPALRAAPETTTPQDLANNLRAYRKALQNSSHVR